MHLLLVAGLLAGLALRPHADTDSFGELEHRGDRYQLTIKVDADRIMQTLGSERPDLAQWQPEDIYEQTAEIGRYVSSHYSLEVRRLGGEERETARLHFLDLSTRRGYEPVLAEERIQEVVVRFDLSLPLVDFELFVQQRLFEGQENSHQHFLRVIQGDRQALLPVPPERGAAILLESPTPQGRNARCLRALRSAISGGWHALAAALFLVAVFVPVRADPGYRPLLALLPFVGAAALTFALVGLGYLQPAQLTVDAAVLFSALYLAGENLVATATRARYLTALLFGLVHGLAHGLALEAAMGSLHHSRLLVLASYEAGVGLTLLCMVVLLSFGRPLLGRVGRPANVFVVLASLTLFGWFLLQRP